MWFQLKVAGSGLGQESVIVPQLGTEESKIKRSASTSVSKCHQLESQETQWGIFYKLSKNVYTEDLKVKNAYSLHVKTKRCQK